MKRLFLIFACGLFFAGCSRQSGTNMGSSPNQDTGMAEQNTVVTARPDRANGAGATAVPPNDDSPQGAALNNASEVSDTNNSAKPQHPPIR